MPRKYEKVQKLLPEVQRLNAEGYTHRQIAEKLGLGGKEVVKQLLQREREKKYRVSASNEDASRQRPYKRISMKTNS